MRCVSRFLRDGRGSVTIEFVLWIPVITALLVVVVDATTLYLTHAEMWNAARDTARRMVTGDLADADAARAHAAAAMGMRDFAYGVDVAYDPNGSAQVLITLPIADISILGYSPLTIVGGTMVARVVMRADPNVPFGSGGGGGGTDGNSGGGSGNSGSGGGNGGGNGGGKGGKGGKGSG